MRAVVHRGEPSSTKTYYRMSRNLTLFLFGFPCLSLDAVFSAFSEVFVDLTDQLIGVDDHEALHATDRRLHPHSIAAQPVYKGLSAQADDVVGYIYSVVSWESYLLNLLPDGVVGIVVVLRNSCGQSVTYELTGNDVSTQYKKTTQQTHYCLSGFFQLMHLLLLSSQ